MRHSRFAIAVVGGLLSWGTLHENPAVSAEEVGPSLYTIPAAGGTPRWLTSDKDHTPGSPVWSPDGQHIAYDIIGPEGIDMTTVVVIRADGSDKINLGLGAMPTWSPDATQLAFHTYKPGGIVVTNRDGTGREQIIDHWGTPRWLPDGDHIASLRNGGIAILDLLTGKETMLVSNQYGAYFGWSISPDGRRAAFSDTGRTALYVADLPTQPGRLATVRIRLSERDVSFASWSPDGKRLVIDWVAPNQATVQLYLLDVDTTDPPTLLPGQDATRHNSQPSWSPDGQTIVYSSEPFQRTDDTE